MVLFFAGNLAESLKFGHILIITGRSTPDAGRFDINLAKGKKPENDIGLHMSFRFDENIAVRNSYDGAWGREERRDHLNSSDGDLPIKRGEDFTIYIFVGETSFHVAINSNEYCKFQHRLPIHNLKAVTMYFNIQTLRGLDHRRAFPFPHPMIQCQDDSVEFSQDMPDLPSVGHVIIISAVPYGNAGRFEFQLNQGFNTDKEALHLSVRFDEGVVVRNTRDDEGYWGDEEGEGPPFPFVLNQLFRIAIGFGENMFRIAINGNYFCDFSYRTDDIFDDLNGFTIATNNDLHLLVRGVDHMRCEQPNLEGFHVFSNPFDLLISNVE